MDLGTPPVLPVLRLPEAPLLPPPVLEVPRATLPTYKPLVVPPSDLRPPPGVQGTTQSDEEQKTTEKKPAPKPVTPPIPKIPQIPQVRYVDVPGTDLTVPLPSNEILATATTTATVSVAATLSATAVFKKTVSVLKPIIKKLLTKKNAPNQELPE